MQIDTSQPIEELLFAWGRWAVSCNAKSEAGCYSIQPFVVKKGGTLPPIDDETLFAVDKAIATLFHKDKQLLQIYEDRFQYGRSLRDLTKLYNKRANICVELKLPNNRHWSPNYIKQLVDISAAKLEGYLVAQRIY
ncbi:hypothetical protein Q4575_05420 [Psychrosphaera sp. 1_MG-2023]|uniref:hypothetical protein n=1 Tax=Psychrosphaera sp. 1_MG-2023 TaxID=3062643 RepID=UPI0026E1AA19|nr:hypothetical protein [Psychrosphaera sp. 1_MG-2023]MDO6718830.1 hypothetical protein [Psychrosphaera sp. 1_MG-2023]